MRQHDNSATREKNWAEKVVDFLLGPSPHPIYVASAGAGFGGVQRPEGTRAKTRNRSDHEGPSAQMTLASFGMSSYSASNSSSRSDGGRR